MNAFTTTIALRRDKKMRGYGVYLRIMELCAEAPGGKLTLTYKEIAWDMREREAFVKSVIEDYGLFIVEDGTIRAAVGATEEHTPEHHVVSVPVAAVTNENNQQPTQKPTQPMDEREIYTKIRDYWNKQAPEPGRAERDASIDEESLRELKATLKEFTPREVCQAMQLAAKDASWSWTFKSALRQKNVKRLLAADAHKKMVEEEKKYEGLSPTAIELCKRFNAEAVYVG